MCLLHRINWRRTREMEEEEMYLSNLSGFGLSLFVCVCVLKTLRFTSVCCTHTPPSTSFSSHKEAFHDSTHLIFFSQHMGGTITPYDIFSRQDILLMCTAHSIIQLPLIIPPPPNQLSVITKEKAVHPLVIHPPKCSFYSNSIFSLRFTLKTTPRWQDVKS